MLEIQVDDPVLRQELLRGPVRYAVRFFFVMVGVMALLTAIVDAVLGDAPAAVAFRLVAPALVTSALMTWLLWRGARSRPTPPEST